MLIVQVCDVHLGFAGDADDEPNVLRLQRVLDRIAALDVRPDLLIATGDLAERGAAASYARATAMFAELAIPFHAIPGNHDDRVELQTAFGLPRQPHVQYVVDAGPVRVVMLDSHAPGRMGGNFCEDRQRWLIDTLDAEPTRPTLLALHHPPFDSGIDWWSASADEPWVRRLDETVRGRANVVGFVAGHVHRAIRGECGGVPVQVCPSVADGLALTLAPIDPDRPDGRALIVDTPPGFALHYWTGSRLVSHVEFVTETAVVARFDETMQPIVRGMAAERGT